MSSIRFLAQELYRAIRKVEKLEERLKFADSDNRGELEGKLFVARAECKRLQKVLGAKKEK
jgi:hypothetical protein